MSDREGEDIKDTNISLDELENLEHEQEHQDDPCYDEDDWGESYDDLDGEAWERQYSQNREENVEPDPWDLD